MAKMLCSLLTSVLLLASAAVKPTSAYTYENFQSNQVGLIQWTSNGGNTINMRSYHVDNDGIRESNWTTGAKSWDTINLNIPAHGDIVAAVHKYSDNPKDVIIRLFFQSKDVARTDPDSKESLYKMMSVYNDRGTGWQVDYAFQSSVGYVGKPRAAICWQDRQGIIRWRLYYLSVTVKAGWSWQIVAQAIGGTPASAAESEQLDIATMFRSNTIYEAALAQGPDRSGWSWSIGNGGAGLDTVVTEPWNHVGVTAVAWGNGTRISVLHWQNNGLSLSPANPGRIREKRWKEGQGWVSQELPNNDWRGFQNSGGSVAAVTWVDPKNIEQIRLYVKWVSVDNNKNQLVEFSANENGWGKQSSRFADSAAAGGPMSAVAWILGSNVQIRIHQARCKFFENNGRCGSVIVGETAFDSGSAGWYNGGTIDGKDWATFKAKRWVG